MTPLHWAVERGHAETVLTLLRFGANVCAETKFGKTSLEIASDVNRPDIFEMLQNAEELRAPDLKSDAATLAATQSIMANEDQTAFDFDDSFLNVGPSQPEAVVKAEPPDVDNIEFLASQGITFPPDDPPSVSSNLRLSQATSSTSSISKTGMMDTSRPVLTASSVAVSQNKPTITRIVRLSSAGQGTKAPAFKIVPASGQTLSTTSKGPKIIKVTPEQFQALKSGNATKLTTLPQVGVKREASSSPSSASAANRPVKIIRVNPSISIQPKKPTVVTVGSSSLPSAPQIKTVKGVPTTKTVIVTKPMPTSSSATSNDDQLKRQLEESQRMVEQFKEQIKRQELENARLKMLLEKN